MRLRSVLCISLFLSGCNTFRLLPPLDRGTQGPEHGNGAPAAVQPVDAEQVQALAEVTTLMKHRKLAEAAVQIKTVHSSEAGQMDPVVVNLLGVLELMEGNGDAAAYRFRQVLALLDSGQVPQAEVAFETEFGIVGKVHGDQPARLEEDREIIMALVGYVRGERQAEDLVAALRGRRRLIPFPPTYEGLPGLCLGVWEDALGRSCWAPQLFSYPGAEAEQRHRTKMRTGAAINLLVAGILGRDLGAVAEARDRLLAQPGAAVDDRLRFHLGVAEALLRTGKERQFLFANELELLGAE